MATSADSEYTLLEEVLPAYVSVAKYLAPSKAAVAHGIPKRDLENATYYSSLSCELLRLQSLLPNYTRSESQIQALSYVLNLFERRLNRTKLPNRAYKDLEHNALRSLQQMLLKFGNKPCSGSHFKDILCLTSYQPSNRARILKRIADLNLALECTGNSTILVFPKRKPPFAKVPELANIAHRIFCSHYQSCGCDAPGKHQSVKLCLKMSQHLRPNAIKEARFEMVLSTSVENQPWKEGEIQVLDAPKSIEPTQSQAPQPPKVAQRKIRFASGTKFERPLTPSAPEDQILVGNICQEIGKVRARLHFLADGGRLRFLKPSRQQIHALNGGKFVTLHDLITGNKFNGLLQKDKYTLAYLVADSILKLYSGRWLKKKWSKQHICFLVRPENQSRPDISFPYLSAQWADPSPCTEEDKYLVHPHQSIQSLGIVLLEIATGTPIESRREGEQHPDLDLEIAEEMLSEFRNKSSSYSPDHILAIETCLNPNQIFERCKTAEDVRWCLYENVVQPLRRIIDGFKVHELYPDTIHTLSVPKSAGPPPIESNELPQASVKEPLEDLEMGTEKKFQERESEMGLLINSGSAIATSKWFEDLYTIVHPLLGETPQRPVRIAILDSGIDLPGTTKLAFKDRLQWKDFTTPESKVAVDLCGHGTHAAGLLLKVAINAMIYVGRITRDGKDFNPSQISEAIRYAHEIWQVDIITMSYGRKERDPKIARAIENATSHSNSSPERGPAIIFAAASNDGNRHQIKWPARADRVICVHATDGDGNNSFSPNPQPGKDFATVGLTVLSYWPIHLHAGEKEVTRFGEVWKDGTSFSTPIAAGVAAIILEYCRPRLMKYARKDNPRELEIDTDAIETLSSIEGMKKVLGMMAEPTLGYRCLIPWNLLHASLSEITICELILDKLR
ncbi:hypothetical protein G7Y89_g15227 [Cudoniella acicularis]|uniref:Peptidase S8/S53 domain-containing protein n=1 Tax=Cudoniella acicularis TaxID=354080 RepID=A0A8H4QT07_9HELO|nr:hypothetical protein G7Y89_g15227 [Cudoniella acicularis]